MATYPGQLGEPAPELSEILTQYTTPSLSSNSSQALPIFLPWPLSLPQGSNTKQNPGKWLKKAKNPRTKTYISFILA